MRRIRKFEQSRVAYWYENIIIARRNIERYKEAKLEKWLLSSRSAEIFFKNFMQ